MDASFLYGFLVGVNLGRFTNLFSSVLISGVTLYMYDPTLYRYDNLATMANTTLSLVKTIKTSL